MSDYTVSELEEAIHEAVISVSMEEESLTREEVEDDLDTYKNEFWHCPKDYPLHLQGETVVPQLIEWVGGEGEGEHAHVVFMVGNQYFKKDAYYASYDGYDWEDGSFREVTPKQKTVTYYS